MGKPILLLRLEGPLQSWGVRSRWDVRDTTHEPTKSGIIGLLGCALGYPTGDERLQVLAGLLRLGVRIENAGAVISDYQTITDFLPTADGRFRVSGGTLNGPASKLAEEGFKPATILSPRFYLEDAAFLAALEAREGAEASPQVLADCARALQNPRWPLFLGRKACVPTRPIYEGLPERYESIEDALRRHPWSWLGACKAPRAPRPEVELAAYIEDEGGSLSRQDAIALSSARTFGFRRVREEFFPAVLSVEPAVEVEDE